MIKILLISLIIIFVFLLYSSHKQAQKTALKKKQLIDKIKNRERD